MNKIQSFAILPALLTLALVGCEKETPAADDGKAASRDGDKAKPAADGGEDTSKAGEKTTAAATPDFGGSTNHGDISDQSFSCVKDWEVKHDWRFKHIGDDKAIEAKIGEIIDGKFSGDAAVFPVGTILQVLPSEAMVKRDAGFNADTKDWEFFELVDNSDGSTTITGRTSAPDGPDSGANLHNDSGKCVGCHSGSTPSWDFTCAADPEICEQIKVAGIKVPAIAVKAAQAADKRCK